MVTKMKPNAAEAGTFLLGDRLPVHRLGFGAMRLTGRGIWGEPENPKEARDVLRRAIELGINFIDTADSYGPEVSENIIAEVLYPYPRGAHHHHKGRADSSRSGRMGSCGSCRTSDSMRRNEPKTASTRLY